MGFENYDDATTYLPNRLPEVEAVVSEDGIYVGTPLLMSDTIYPSTPSDISAFLSTSIVEDSTPYLVTLDALTSVLLHFNEGSFGYQFTDSSTYPKIFSQGTTNWAYSMNKMSKYGDGSIFFDGTDDYLTLSDDAVFDFGTNDFTIECWIYPWDNLLSTRYLYNQYSTSGTYCCYWYIDEVSGVYSMGFRLSTNGTTATTYSTAIPALIPTKWYHLAVMRSGTTIYFFVDGVVQGSSEIGSVTLFNSDADIVIGATYTGTNLFGGWIDDYRVTNGSARYIPATPSTPTEEFTSDANTSLLILGNNPHGSTPADSSGSPKTITSVGDVFNWGTPQTLGNNCLWLQDGGYIKCEGTQDLNFDNDDFTIHFWMNPSVLPSTSTYDTLVSKCFRYNSNLQFLIEIYNNGGTYRLSIRWSYNGSTAQQQITNYAFVEGTNYHIAVVRNGTNLVSYVNGTTLATTAVSTNSIFKPTASNAQVYPLLIGAYYNGASPNQNFTGFIDEFVIKREAIWTTDFTPPTEESSP